MREPILLVVCVCAPAAHSGCLFVNYGHFFFRAPHVYHHVVIVVVVVVSAKAISNYLFFLPPV